MEFRIDDSSVPEALVAEVPQDRRWWHWLTIVLAAPAALLFLGLFLLALWIWIGGLGPMSPAGWVEWFVILIALVILAVAQFAWPYLALWYTLPQAFGVDRVIVEDGVLRGQLTWRWMRLPSRRIVLGEHRDLETGVVAARGGRLGVHVRGRHAVPVLIQGRMTADEAQVLADDIRACTDRYQSPSASGARRIPAPVEQAHPAERREVD